MNKIKTTKRDVLTMVYQFVGCGIVFVISVYSNIPGNITSNVVYPLSFRGFETGSTFGFFIIKTFLIPLGIVGLIIQRKIYKNGIHTTKTS